MQGKGINEAMTEQEPDIDFFTERGYLSIRESFTMLQNDVYLHFNQKNLPN